MASTLAWASAVLQNTSICRPAPLSTLVGSWTVFWDTGAVRKLDVQAGGEENGGYLLVSSSTGDGVVKGAPSRLRRYLSGPFTERASNMEWPAILGHESSDDLPPLLSYRLWTRFCQETAVFQSDRLTGNATASTDFQQVRWNSRKAVAFRDGSVVDVPMNFESSLMEPIFVAFAGMRTWSFPEFVANFLPPKGRIGIFSQSAGVDDDGDGRRGGVTTARSVSVQSAPWRSRLVFNDAGRNISGSKVSIAIVADAHALPAAWRSSEDNGVLLGPCDIFRAAARFAALHGRTLGQLRFARNQCSWILSRGRRPKLNAVLDKSQGPQLRALAASSNSDTGLGLGRTTTLQPCLKLPVQDALDLYPQSIFLHAGKLPRQSHGWLFFGCKPMGAAGTGVRLGNVLFLAAATIAAATDTRRSMLAMINFQWKDYFSDVDGIFSLLPASLWYYRSSDIDMLVGSPTSMKYKKLVLPPEKKGIMMHGYFQNIRYFWHRLDLVRALLAPQPLRQKAANIWEKWTEDNSLSLSSTFVALHVRLGDTSGLGVGYYRNAVTTLRQRLFTSANSSQEKEEEEEEVICVYFSDSPERVLLMMAGTSCTRSFVFPDRHLRDDLALMTMATCCSGIVLSASTFSWWAAVLGSYRNVVAPETTGQACSGPDNALSMQARDAASQPASPSLTSNSSPIPPSPSTSFEVSAESEVPASASASIAEASVATPHNRDRDRDSHSSRIANEEASFSLGRVPGWVQIPVPCKWAAAAL